MNDEIEFAIPMPLDGDGFLRRECPSCEREFKWLPATADDDESVTPVPDGGYFCPYCGVQAPQEAWWTKDQLSVAEAMAHNKIMKPAMDDVAKEFKKLERSSGGFVSFKVDTKPVPEEVVPTLTEANDLVRVEFLCHPSEPVKVLEDWAGPTHCLVCGSPASS